MLVYIAHCGCKVLTIAKQLIRSSWKFALLKIQNSGCAIELAATGVIICRGVSARKNTEYVVGAISSEPGESTKIIYK
jgi:hypothetical protein